MNVYFIVEGEITEAKLYPRWLSFYIPELTRVDRLSQVTKNNYFLICAGGIPNIYNHIINAIKDVNDYPVFDYLVACLDGEEIGVNRRREILNRKIKESGINLSSKCKFESIIQNPCVETWLLGNKKIAKRTPQNGLLLEYMKFYDVRNYDPELMGAFPGFNNRAKFHYSYLRETLSERRLIYRKDKPEEVLKKGYWEQLVKRTIDTDHLASLKECFNFFSTLKNQIET